MLENLIQGESKESVMNAIDDICGKYKCFDTLLKNLSDAAKLVDYVSEMIKYISAIEAYNNASIEFKNVLADLANEMILMNPSYGQKFMEAYKNFATSLDYDSIVQNILVYGSENGIWLVLDLTSSLMQKTAIHFSVRVFGLEKAAASKLCAAIWAYEVGFAFGDMITNNSDKMNFRRLLRANYHIDNALHALVERYASKLKQSNSYSDALVFDSAFNLYKHTQLYSIDIHIGYLKSASSDCITFFTNKKGDYKREIEAKAAYIDLWKKIICHNDQAPKQQFEYQSDILTIACPTDIYIYDKLTRKLVASIVNNEVFISDTDITILVINDEKAVCLPDVDDYEVKIVANGNGEMDFRCNRIVDCESVESVAFTDVALKENDEFAFIKPFADVEKIEESYLGKSDGSTILPDFSSPPGNSDVPDIPSEPIKADIIAQPTETTISYGDAIILHVDETKIPVGGRVEWTADNGNFKYSANGNTCRIDPNKSGSTTFTATIYDSQGNAVSKDEQVMTSKAGFFDKIIAFFKKLFGLTKVIPQSLKYIY